MAKGTEAKEAVSRAQNILQTISDFREIINEFEEISSDITEFKIYLDLAKPTLTDYRGVIEKFAAYNVQSDEFPSISDFTKNYVKLLADAEKILKKYDLESNLLNNKSDSVNSLKSSCSSSHTRDNVKLPRISLPKFNGNPSEYRSFVDTFEALIDSNKELSQIEKFLYLENSLTGAAAYILKGMQATDASYSLAKDLLNERFCNRKLLVFSQLDALFDASVLTKEVYLRQFYDKFTAHCRALDNETISDAEYKAAILAYIVQNKTDSKTSQAFSKAFPKAIPTLEEINNFLSIRCNVIDSANISMHKQTSLNKNFKQLNINKNFNFNAKTTQVHAQTVRNSCIVCKEQHFIAQCPKFIAMPIKVRSAKVRSLNGCFVCLRQHKGKCSSKWSCRFCHKGHHYLLCFTQIPRRTSPARSRADSDVASRDDREQANEMPSTSTVCNFSANAETILPTAQLRAIGQGDIIEARVLLDTGSQSNFVTEDLCKRLNSPCYPINLKLNGINCSTATCTKYTQLKIASSTGRYQSTIKCLVIPKITSVLPRISFARNALKIPNNIRLADPSFNCSSGIDILIGSSTFFKLMLPDRTSLENSKLILQNTLLGWIVIGDMPDRHFPKSQATNSVLATTCLNATSISELNQNIIKFWEVDNSTPSSKNSLLSKEERYCEQYFMDTIQRDHDGKLVVSIPFNQNLAGLGESKAIAEKRFLNLEKRLHSNPSLFKEYSEFMSEYENLGHMTKVSKEPIANAPMASSIIYAHDGPIDIKDIPRQYFPHHAVVKEASLTTKLRVVFDASAKSSSGISVNDAQIVGPQVQDNLFDILLRFRSCEVALCGDIAKMYRMVKVSPVETKFQNILWRTSPSDKLETYRLNTITYGTASASFLATRCLQYIADSHEETFPEASKVISKHFYMDDLLFCANSIEHVLRIKAEVTNILATAGLIIRKFLSNKPEVLDTPTDSDTVDFSTVPIGERTDSKTLGLHWDSVRDLLFCKVELPASPTLTKRGILSSVAKIYDPLGLYAPLVVRGKLLIQRLWQSKLDWDDQVPAEISTMWSELEREFRHLDNIKVPRCIIPATYVKLQLHGFADASSAAYGACIYIRCVTLDGRTFTNLLTSKSRVAPLRTMTIPRLELCAAVILSELVQKTVRILNVQFDDIFLWTDSQIVLNWINSCPSKYKIFVANRIAVIQELTELKSWRYIKGSDNPADIVSRGTSLADLATLNTKWFTGPSFLHFRDSDWNLPEFYVNANEQLESKNPSISTNIATHAVDSEFSASLFSRYSAFGVHVAFY